MARAEPGSDEALLRAVAAGDAAALTQLYERHAGALFGYLYRLAGDRMTEGTVVSALPHEGGMRYRVVAPAAPGPQAHPVEPGLEDGYLALTNR